MINNIIKEINKHINTANPETIKYGEVFTNLELVEKMIDCIPDIFWKNINLKILDPCNGVGNFPAIIIKKLMEGLKEFEPNETNRYKYIIENIIYVCEIQEINMEYYINIFNPNEDNHINYYTGSFISDDFNKQMNIWGVEIFDLIIGNPPYQIGKDTRSSISIYHKFVERAVEISKMVLMITPSKWYSNPSMFDFRQNMIENYGLKILTDVKGAFKKVEIKGGVSYFLLEKEYKGMCLYNNQYREFKNGIITIENLDEILIKLKSHTTFGEKMFSDQYFDIRNIDDRFRTTKDNDCILCHVSTKNGNIKYIKENELKIKPNYLKYKVFMPTASGSKENIGELGRILIGEPKDVCSRSFVHFSFETKKECESFVSYLNTNLIKRLIGLKKQTQLVKKDCFSLVPIVPLDRHWNDEMLTEYFKL